MRWLPNRAAAFCSLSARMPSALVEGVRPVDFRDVPGLAAQKAAALVAGHVQPGRARLGVALDKVRYRCVHWPASWAAFIMMAHSMRLRNSSQPAS